MDENTGSNAGASDGAVPLLVIGGGNMGAALVGGMLDAEVVDAADLAVVEVSPARREALHGLLPDVAVLTEPPAAADAVLVAVKPADAASAASIAPSVGARRLLSIAAGVTVETLGSAAGPEVAVIRAMPNTPALVRLGASAITGGATATEDDLAWAESILTAVGTVERLSEAQLDLFTGLAGSGPAYVFLVAESLIDAAVAEGFPRPIAERVVGQVLLGASSLLVRDGDAPTLRANVTSPGGTTAAGLAALEERAVRAAFAAAISAATDRSRQLGS